MNIESIKTSIEEKKFRTFGEIQEMAKNYEMPKFLWSGIKEKSIGLVFGPSKSGKSTFCENLGMHLAFGANDFFGEHLDGKPRKVLFVGLEEHWLDRVVRNSNQLEVLNDKERELVCTNFMYQDMNTVPFIRTNKDWDNLIETIKSSEAEVVFIDSITRMNHGDLDDSKTVEKIMQKLRVISQQLGVALICIHHTRKIEGKPITMDSIKGSSTFAQESDFAFGFNRTLRGHRYMKKVFFRHTSDDFEKVQELEIDVTSWLNPIEMAFEDEILSRNDRRKNNEARDSIKNYFNQSPCQTFKTGDLVNYFTSSMDLKERQIKTYLTELTKSSEIVSPNRGYYTSVNCD